MPNPMDATPIADLYRCIAGEVRLVAGRRQEDGVLVFPMPEGSEEAKHDLVLLPATGTLWSWTVQRFAPKLPYDGSTGDDFRPYAVAYVQLGDNLIIEGRVTPSPPPPLTIGRPMRVVRESYATDAQGQPIETYAFTPMEKQL